MAQRILIADKLAKSADGILIAAGFDVDRRVGLSEDELVKAVDGATAILVRSAVKVTTPIIAGGRELKVIGRAGTGVDNIDVSSATNSNVLVMNVPGGNTVTAAEHTIGLMFAMARMIPQGNASLAGGAWERSKFTGRELTGKTLGIIGFGAIGKVVADRAMGLRMRVACYDPVVPLFEIEGAGAIACETIEELLAVADIVTVHTPLNNATRGILGAKAFASMKDGAMVINCARGGIVDEDALYNALVSSKISGAAIDVWTSEPPTDRRLIGLPNVVATPHLGASTCEAQVRVADSIARQVRDYLVKGSLFGAVNSIKEW